MTERTITTATVAKLLVLSCRRVRQLTDQGVLQRARDPVSGEELKSRYLLQPTVNAYVVFLRDHRFDDPRETDYQRDRCRRMAALVTIEELRVKRVRSELHHARDVEFVMTHMLTALKSRLLALPLRCTPYLTNKKNTGELRKTIRIEVYDALKELSGYDPAMFEAANEEYLASLGTAKPGTNGDKP